MLHVIADLESELTKFIFDGVTRPDVRLIHHPARAHGAWNQTKRWFECALPNKRLDLLYSPDLLGQLGQIREGDSVLLFSIINPKNLCVLAKYLQQAKVHAFLWNPLREHGADPQKAALRLNAVRQLTSNIATFDPQDAHEQRLRLVPQPFRNIPTEDDKATEVDFCFIGMDKGRLPFLMRFAEAAERAGRKCFIHVLADKGRQYSAQERAFLSQDYFSYADNLAQAKRAKCLLEVVQDSQSGATLRSVESLFMARKLITTRKAIRTEPGFDEKRVLVIDRPDDAAIESFMHTAMPPVDAAVLQAHEINHWLDAFF